MAFKLLCELICAYFTVFHPLHTDNFSELLKYTSITSYQFLLLTLYF
jgi:hypothetical protein